MTDQHQDIEVRSADGGFAAYLATSDAPNGVAVVVLQEIFGVNADIRAIADTFAASGYVAVAPDLYWRQEANVQLDPATVEGRERAMQLMKRLDRDQAVADGAAALEAARERVPGLTRSAAVGYCFGGSVAYLMAARGEVDAGIAYYGTGLQTMLGEAHGLQGRLLLHIAGDDHLCPAVAQEAIKAEIAKLGNRATAIVHPGVGHAFARRGGATFDQEAAERANRMTLDMLASLAEAV
jgi:carboxymethylenebutenolidase